MLRILRMEAAGEPTTLRLDGQLKGRWVNLLRRTCKTQLKKGARVTIDLRNVSFADRDGIGLLQSLTNQQVEIRNVLPFIAEQITKATSE